MHAAYVYIYTYLYIRTVFRAYRIATQSDQPRMNKQPWTTRIIDGFCAPLKLLGGDLHLISS